MPVEFNKEGDSLILSRDLVSRILRHMFDTSAFPHLRGRLGNGEDAEYFLWTDAREENDHRPCIKDMVNCFIEGALERPFAVPRSVQEPHCGADEM